MIFKSYKSLSFVKFFRLYSKIPFQTVYCILQVAGAVSNNGISIIILIVAWIPRAVQATYAEENAA